MTNTKAIKLVIATVTISSALLLPAFAEEPNTIPYEFKATLGGFDGPSYKVELRNGALYYSVGHISKGNPIKITPSPKDWKEFREALDNLNIWQWQINYPNLEVLDGTQWSLRIKYQDQSLETGGSNSYPKKGGEPSNDTEYTEEFSKYTEAVRKLLGGKEF
jgi:hypothetical protein